MSDLPEPFWENLLLFIEEGRVVPIIGHELVTVRDQEREIPLPAWRCGSGRGKIPTTWEKTGPAASAAASTNPHCSFR